MRYGYSFHWPCGQAPYLVTPDGFQVDCTLENNVPILLTSRGFPRKFATPATKSRLEEALPRPNEPPVSGCDAPASGGGLMRIPPVGAMPPQAGYLRQVLRKSTPTVEMRLDTISKSLRQMTKRNPIHVVISEQRLYLLVTCSLISPRTDTAKLVFDARCNALLATGVRHQIRVPSRIRLVTFVFATA